jgi:hypothetical protein
VVTILRIIQCILSSRSNLIRATVADAKIGNSTALLDFLKNNRIAAASRLSPDEIDDQIREEREAWEYDRIKRLEHHAGM